MSLVPGVDLALRAEALVTEHRHFALEVEHHRHALGVEQATGMIRDPGVGVIRDHGAGVPGVEQDSPGLVLGAELIAQ